MGLAAVKLALLQKESQELQQSASSVVDDTVSHSTLISIGLDLEELQYVQAISSRLTNNLAIRRRLQTDILALGPHATDTQLAKVQERKNTLTRKIDSWCAVQVRYIPGLATLRTDSPETGEHEPHKFPLWLPSTIGNRISCDPHFYVLEWELRYAQANDALQELRRYLQLRSHLYKHKDRFAFGVQAHTRANTTISRVQRSINGSAAQYRTARSALQQLALQLKKDSASMASLPELLDTDIRAMATGLDEESEGRRSLSWIWKHDGIANGSDNLHECMYI
jgi:hypothetical protein